jgi:hypothetical protein
MSLVSSCMKLIRMHGTHVAKIREALKHHKH